MHDTSASLLARLGASPDPEAWQKLVSVYTPLLRDWIRRYGLQDSDRDDLVQEVLTVVVRDLPTFQHNGRPGAFRSWLRTILIHRLKNFWRDRRHQPLPASIDVLTKLEELEDADSGLSRLWNQEHDRYVVKKLLDMIRGDFQRTTWEAFARVMFDSEKPADAATRLGVSVNAVLLAKSRILHRLRQVGQGLVD